MEDDLASVGGRRGKNGWNGEVKAWEGTRAGLREGAIIAGLARLAYWEEGTYIYLPSLMSCFRL